MSRSAPHDEFMRAGQADKKNLKKLKILLDKTKFYDILSFYIRNSAETTLKRKLIKNLKIFQICA